MALLERVDRWDLLPQRLKLATIATSTTPFRPFRAVATRHGDPEAGACRRRLGVDWLDVHSEPWEQAVFTGPLDEYFGWKLGRPPSRSLRFEFIAVAKSWIPRPASTLNGEPIYPMPTVRPGNLRESYLARAHRAPRVSFPGRPRDVPLLEHGPSRGQRLIRRQRRPVTSMDRRPIALAGPVVIGSLDASSQDISLAKQDPCALRDQIGR